MNTENEMKIVTSEDGTKIAYRVTGSGLPLVLLHGRDTHNQSAGYHLTNLLMQAK